MTDWEKRVYNSCNRGVQSSCLEFSHVNRETAQYRYGKRTWSWCLLYLLQQLRFPVCWVVVRCERPSVFQKELHITSLRGPFCFKRFKLLEVSHHRVETNNGARKNPFCFFLSYSIPVSNFLTVLHNWLYQFSFLRTWECVVFTAKHKLFCSSKMTLVFCVFI